MTTTRARTSHARGSAAGTAARRPRRDATINLRADRAQRGLIDRAAEAAGKSRSEFMLEASCRAAEDVLIERRVFNVDSAKFRRFVIILDAPAPDLAKIRRLLSTPAPWE